MRRCRLVLADRLFCLPDDGRECFRLFDGQIGEDLTIEFNSCKAKAMNELRILDVVQPASGVDTHDPQFSKIAFLQFAAGISKVKSAFDRLLSRTVQLRLGTAI